MHPQADIVDVIGSVVDLVPMGRGRWKGRCPFHMENTPSFIVRRDKGSFICYGCGLQGDQAAFVERYQRREKRT